MVESYATAMKSNRHKKRHNPEIPLAFKKRLIYALEETHKEMLTPPPGIRDDPEKLSRWRPKVKRNIDWDEAFKANLRRSEGKWKEPDYTQESKLEGTQDQEAFITIGLIGASAI